MTAPFTPTHTIPDGGLPAWNEPDPRVPAAAHVDGRVEVALVEQRGDWAKVAATNGWSGWIDARRLVGLPGAAGPRAVVALDKLRPTHMAPATGLTAWAEPDASRPPVATIDPWLELQVIENRGPWARVLCSNGWSAWVDGRVLAGTSPAVPSPAGFAPPGVPRAPTRLAFSPALAGVLVVAVGSFLPWIEGGGFGSGSSFRVPIKFLFNFTSAGNGPKIGLLLLAIAIAGGAFSLLPGWTLLARIAGGLAVLVPAVYVVQMSRLIHKLGRSNAPKLSSVIGFGVLVVAGGGIALIVGQGRSGTGRRGRP